MLVSASKMWCSKSKMDIMCKVKIKCVFFSVSTYQHQEHYCVPEECEDGDDPDEDPQGDGGHDVLTGVEIIRCRGAGDRGDVGAVIFEEVNIVLGIGVGAQVVPLRSDTQSWHKNCEVFFFKFILLLLLF